MSAAEPPTSLDFPAITRLSRAQLAGWLWRRLNGRDPFGPLDVRSGDLWHLLFADLYFSPEVDGDFRRAFRACVLEALEDAVRFPEAERWREPAAVVELLMLAPVVLNDGTREDVLQAARLLVEGHRRFPWRAPWTHGGEIRLRLRGLMALVELRWDRIPPEQHPPAEYWESLWEPTVMDVDDPTYGYAGEQAALIFESLEKTQCVQSPGQPDRYKRLEAAFRWFGAARPWREKYMLSALKALLVRRLLPRVSSATVLSLIQNECCPLLANDHLREQVNAILAGVVFSDSAPLYVPAWLDEAIQRTCSSVVVLAADGGCVEVFCDGLDREYITVLMQAAEKASDLYQNSPKYRQHDSIANFLRQHRGDLQQVAHPLHSRFDSYQQFTFEQLIAVKRRVGIP